MSYVTGMSSPDMRKAYEEIEEVRQKPSELVHERIQEVSNRLADIEDRLHKLEYMMAQEPSPPCEAVEATSGLPPVYGAYMDSLDKCFYAALRIVKMIDRIDK